MSVIDRVKKEWRAFEHDEPGERFQHQHDRMQECSRALRVAQGIAGVLLVLAGIVMLFVPGPGLLVMLFGFALLAGLSRTLAKLLDRAEPALRRQGALMRRGWGHLTRAAKAGIATISAFGMGAIGVGLYGLVT